MSDDSTRPRRKKKKKKVRPQPVQKKQPPLLAIIGGSVLCCLIIGILLGVFVFSGSDADGTSESETAQAEPTIPAEHRDRAEELIEDVNDALKLLDSNSEQLFVASFFSPEVKMKVGNLFAPNPTNSKQRKERAAKAKKEFLTALSWHLESALSGEFQFTSDGNMAEIHYQLTRPKENFNPSSFPVPKPDQAPRGSVPGLGGDLKQMLSKAAGLIESGKTEEFVLSVYPLPMVANLQTGDAMGRHLERINQSEFKQVMVEELKESAAANVSIQGNIAAITLPAKVQGDPKRVFKFEKVQGNWRFIDHDQPHRATLVKLAQAPPQEISTSAEKTFSIVLSFNHAERKWVLKSEPQEKVSE